MKNKLVLIFEDGSPRVSVMRHSKKFFNDGCRTCLIFNNEMDARTYFKKHSFYLEPLSLCSGYDLDLQGTFTVNYEDTTYTGKFYWAESH